MIGPYRPTYRKRRAKPESTRWYLGAPWTAGLLSHAQPPDPCPSICIFAYTGQVDRVSEELAKEAADPQWGKCWKPAEVLSTALDSASAAGHPDIVRVLILAGATSSRARHLAGREIAPDLPLEYVHEMREEIHALLEGL